MEDFPLSVFVGAIIILALIGIVHLSIDFRNFGLIETQCDTQGYIQDEHTRIVCQVEKK